MPADASSTLPDGKHKGVHHDSAQSFGAPANRWEWASSIALQAADALAYAHEMGVMTWPAKSGQGILLIPEGNFKAIRRLIV